MNKITLGLIVIFMVFTALPAFGQLAVEGEGSDLFIKNGTVITVTNGTIENASIHVRNGKIHAVGQGLSVPRNSRVIDATGRFIIPGIIDSHSHMGIEGGINESAAIVCPEINIQDVIKPDDISFHRALAGGVTAINTMHGSANPIGGRNAVLKLKYGRPAEELLVPGAMEGIKFALGENPKRSNFASPAGRRFPVSRMGVMHSIREAFTEAKEYMKEWEIYEAKQRSRSARNQWERRHGLVPPRRDLRLETLADILRGKLTILCHGYRAEEMLALMQLGDEMGFKVYSFEHCSEGYKIAPELAAHGAIASIFTDSWGYKMEVFDGIPYNAAIMIDNGVVVAVNSDSGERVRRLYNEAARLLRYGVSEEDALKTITLNPAIMLKIDDRTGSIEKGKDADLAIFNAHPFSVYTKCEMTLIEGEIYFDLNNAATAAGLLDKARAKAERNTL